MTYLPIFEHQNSEIWQLDRNFWQHSQMTASEANPTTPTNPKTNARRIQVRQSGVHGKGVFALQTSPKAKRSLNTLVKSFPHKKLKTATLTIHLILTTRFIFKSMKTGSSMHCMVVTQLAGLITVALQIANLSL